MLETPSTQVAVGVLHGFNMNSNGGGIGYVVGTRGSVLGSVTVGGGLAYGSTGGKAGIVMVGGERTVRRNLKLMTENYVWKDGNGVVSGGRASLRRAALRRLRVGVPGRHGRILRVSDRQRRVSSFYDQTVADPAVAGFRGGLHRAVADS